MEKPKVINKDTDVKIAPRLLFGNDLMLNDSMNNIGLNYGLKKAIVYDNYAIFQATASLNFNTLRTTGSINYPKNELISMNANISFMMVHTFIKTDALLV